MTKTLIILSILFSCFPPEEEIKYITEIHTYEHSVKEIEIGENLNRYRNSKNLPSLVLNENISYICNEHNLYMISVNKLTHEGFQERQNKLGVSVMGENLARNVDNPIVSWENSAPHKANMESDYTRYGIAEKDGYITLIMIR